MPRPEQAEQHRNRSAPGAGRAPERNCASALVNSREALWSSDCTSNGPVLDLTPSVPTDPISASTRAPATSAWRGGLFRFAFCYWLLFCIPILSTQIAGLDWIGKLISPAWNAMVVWVGEHVLGISSPINVTANGSGDKTADWVFLFCIAVLALVGAVIWSLLDRRRAHDAQLRELLGVVLRYTVAFVVIGYGISKVFLGQFPPPSSGRLTQQYGDSSPMGLMWTFMGASGLYVFFSGALETIGALLLLWRRTAALGALVLGTVLTNVVMMNFCYDVPVKINSSHYLGMCIFVLLPELGRLIDVFVRHRPAQLALRELVLPGRRLRVARWVLKYGALAVVLFFNVKPRIERQTEVTPWYDGYWSVTAFSRNGQDAPPLVTDTARWRRLRLQVARAQGYARWQFMDGLNGALYTFAIDETAHTFTFKPIPGDAGNASNQPTPEKLTYVHPDADHLELEGKVGAQDLRVRLERFDAGKMLLVSRGFHWINEVPFNR
jgi:hypothetical protein